MPAKIGTAIAMICRGMDPCVRSRIVKGVWSRSRTFMRLDWGTAEFRTVLNERLADFQPSSEIERNRLNNLSFMNANSNEYHAHGQRHGNDIAAPEPIPYSPPTPRAH